MLTDDRKKHAPKSRFDMTFPAAAKQRILVVESSRSGIPGGSFHSALLLVRNLVNRHYQVFMLFYGPHSMTGRFEAAGATVLPFLYGKKNDGKQRKSNQKSQPIHKENIFKRVIRKFPHYYNIKRFILFDSRQMVHIARVIKKYKIDIVHLNNGITPNRDGIIASKICRKPCVVHERKIRAYDSVDIFLSRFISRLIAISKTVYNNCICHPLRVKKIKQVYNPFILNPIDQDRVFEIKSRYQNLPIITMAGNIIRWKGQSTFLKAIANVNRKLNGEKFKALIVGGVMDETYYGEIKKIVADHNLETIVEFTGFVEDMQNYMKASDLIVHASDKPEPLGRVVLEALFLNKVVIAADEGGPTEVIRDGVNGFLFKSRNAQDLSIKILKALKGNSSPDLMMPKDVLHKFSAEKHTEQIIACYNNI